MKHIFVSDIRGNDATISSNGQLKAKEELLERALENKSVHHNAIVEENQIHRRKNYNFELRRPKRRVEDNVTNGESQQFEGKRIKRRSYESEL